jgi:hypothetical protein
MRYFETHRPEKAGRVDLVLETYKGRHAALRKDLKSKYGVDPLDRNAFATVGGGSHGQRTDLR